ncbi:unnamed protein product [Darwinula stevensoni]|uniref:DnaJ homolog subfamily C member 16 n=1 Tax=Darwinula stevensoni TaxID=69355 RepID=A0A7R8ZY26_9CRUS|nr:unnamed protein product [Darwinula stevensoni]CAG0880674.1 unnamed protein product [Darwinula stevensoni]
MWGGTGILLICTLTLLPTIHGFKNPYDVLGVRRKADIQEIRKAYKQLAKEWHPDKNNDPEAESKFVEITKAYELLSDPARRKKFDDHGITEDTSNLDERPDYSKFHRFAFDEFEDFFGFAGKGFNFFQNGDSLYHKMTITGKHFENHIKPESYKKPYVILFYSDMCFSCVHAEPVWRKIDEEMSFIGIGTATMHAGHERAIAKKIGISSLPGIVVTIDGQSWVYKENMLSSAKVMEFVKRRFHANLIETLNEDTISPFLQGWTDNRVRIIIFAKLPNPRLRYTVIAHQYQERAAFGYVKVATEEGKRIMDKYGVEGYGDTVLLFNEITERPVASLSMSEIPVNTLRSMIESNQYLILPRLSNQQLFDTMCPAEASRYRKHLCVVLLTSDKTEHEPYRTMMREFALNHDYSKRVKFLYLLVNKQEPFVTTLIENPGNIGDPNLKVVIIWRKEDLVVKYEWLSISWDVATERANLSKSELEKTIHRLLQAEEVLLYEVKIDHLLDEHAPSLTGKIMTKFLLAWDTLQESVAKEDLIPALSVFGTVIFIIVIGYFMSYLMRMEEESIQKRRAENSNSATGSKPKPPPEPQLKIHELRGETYNGLIRLLKPGCRTLVIILDKSSMKPLLLKFHRAMWPYRKNKTLMFAYLHVDRGLDWFKKLLYLAIPELDGVDLNINPKNVLGTVLSLNGHRKYFCMYHAKYRDHGFNQKGSGAFMGFEDSQSSDEDVEAPSQQKETERIFDQYESDILFIEHLLDALPNWLDRLFEGTTKRYHVNYWPDSIGK